MFKKIIKDYKQSLKIQSECWKEYYCILDDLYIIDCYEVSKQVSEQLYVVIDDVVFDYPKIKEYNKILVTSDQKYHILCKLYKIEYLGNDKWRVILDNK